MVGRVLTYGTFDIIHSGHINLLASLHDFADYVVVGVSTDAFNELKGKRALMSYGDRKRVLEAIRFVDLVIPEETWEQKIDDVKRYKIDTFAIGDDWAGEFDFLSRYCDVRYLPRTRGVSSSSLKRLSSDLSLEHIRALSDAVSTMSAILRNFDVE